MRTPRRLSRAAGPALFALCLAWTALFLAQKIDLTTADLGRHLKNGEAVASFLANPFDRGKAGTLFFNTYSYTHGDFPVINHHWGSGLVFYAVQKAFGFEGLSVFFLTLLLSGWALMFALAARRGGWAWAAVWALWLMPVFAARREVRPEAFSVLFAAVFVLLLERHSKKKIPARALAAALALLQVLWTNLHIYFVLGPLIAALYAMHALLKKTEDRAGLAAVFACVSAATLANPFGVRGVLYPLFIFGNYGYRLVENQSIPFLENLRYSLPNFVFFKTAAAAIACAVLLEALAKRRPPSPPALLALAFAAAGWRAIRNFQLFALFALPALAAGFSALTDFRGLPARRFRNAAMVLCAAAAVASTITAYRGHPFRPFAESGIGLRSEAPRSADFFRREGLHGPIFNNYDIGGYLIYELWPRERVFVDNRPEAYPASFLQNILVSAQESEDRWRELDAEYRFNVIFFSHRDLTPWAQAFLIRRLQDPDWAPVFADGYAVIFLRRTVENASIILRRELPKSAFRVISNP